MSWITIAINLITGPHITQIEEVAKFYGRGRNDYTVNFILSSFLMVFCVYVTAISKKSRTLTSKQRYPQMTSVGPKNAESEAINIQINMNYRSDDPNIH